MHPFTGVALVKFFWVKVCPFDVIVIKHVSPFFNKVENKCAYIMDIENIIYVFYDGRVEVSFILNINF